MLANWITLSRPAFSGFPADSAPARAVPSLTSVFRATAGLAVVFCVSRGLPVIVSSLRRYWGTYAAPQPEET
jgi:hypothetical protein